MLLSPFTYAIAYMSSLSIAGFYLRIPVMRLYLGTLASTAGLLALSGYHFSAEAIVYGLFLLKAALMLEVAVEPIDILWKVALFFICQALMQAPDIHYAASMGIYALAPSYYLLGSIAPGAYSPLAQGLLHVLQAVSALTYVVLTALPIYTATLHIVFLTVSIYEFGRWTSRLRAV
jgi:hypothetical protein